MGIFFIYILKSAVCLSLFYLFYWWLLSKETFHRFNRVALLGILGLSTLIPFIEVTTGRESEVHQAMMDLEQLLSMSESRSRAGEGTTPGTVFSWMQLLLAGYAMGILFFVGRHLYSLSCLLLLIKGSKRSEWEKGITLVVHNGKVAPFSWMKFIVISRKDFEENAKEILTHEKAHISNRHSWDLIVADVCIFLQWFNPGAWLLKQELQNIHEYEADETVLKEGVNAKEYQLLLIRKAVGTRLYSMTNSFNHSKLKKRITMMLKEKSNPWARLKYLYVLPLAAVAVTAFARPEISETVNEISAAKVSNLVSIVETNVPESAKTKVATTLPQDTIVVVGTTARKKGTATAKDKENKAVLLSPTKGFSREKSLKIVNGKETSDAVVNALRAEYIKSVNVLKGESALEKYGEKGKDGVLEIILLSDEEILNKKGALGGRVTKKSDSLKPDTTAMRIIPGINYYNLKSSAAPLMIVNGKEITKDLFSKISPDQIESISVFKEGAALKTYGERGKNGVIVVTLKNNKKKEEEQK